MLVRPKREAARQHHTYSTYNDDWNLFQLKCFTSLHVNIMWNGWEGGRELKKKEIEIATEQNGFGSILQYAIIIG